MLAQLRARGALAGSGMVQVQKMLTLLNRHGGVGGRMGAPCRRVLAVGKRPGREDLAAIPVMGDDDMWVEVLASRI